MRVFICSSISRLIAAWKHRFKLLSCIVLHSLRLNAIAFVLLTLWRTINQAMLKLWEILISAPELVVRFLTILHNGKPLRFDINTFSTIRYVVLIWIRIRGNMLYLLVRLIRSKHYLLRGCINKLLHCFSLLLEFHESFICCLWMQNFIPTPLCFHYWIVLLEWWIVLWNQRTIHCLHINIILILSWRILLMMKIRSIVHRRVLLKHFFN